MASIFSCLLWLWLLLSFTAFQVKSASAEACITSANCSTPYSGTSTCFLRECLSCSSDEEVPFYKDKDYCEPVCNGPGAFGDQQCRARTENPDTYCFLLPTAASDERYNGYFDYNGTATYKDSAGILQPIKGYCAICEEGRIFDAKIALCVIDPNAPPPPSPPAPSFETPLTPTEEPLTPPSSYTPTTYNQPKQGKKKSPVGAIVGSIFGVFGFLGFAAVIVLLLIRRHNMSLMAYTGSQKDAPPSGPAPSDPPPPPLTSMPPPDYPQGDPTPPYQPYAPPAAPTSQV